MVGCPNFVRVVKMGKEIGIIIVKMLTGVQDENMDDDWEANILCEIENYEEKYGIDTYESEESVSELKDTIGFNVALNHVSDLKKLSLYEQFKIIWFAI